MRFPHAYIAKINPENLHACMIRWATTQLYLNRFLFFRFIFSNYVGFLVGSRPGRDPETLNFRITFGKKNKQTTTEKGSRAPHAYTCVKFQGLAPKKAALGKRCWLPKFVVFNLGQPARVDLLNLLCSQQQ